MGTEAIDGDDYDIYSTKIPTNIFSLVSGNDKYSKSRPPPTYINYYSLNEVAKRTIHHPMKDLNIRKDLNRLECTNEQVNSENKTLRSYAVKQAAKGFFRGSFNFSLPAYAFGPVSNVSAFMNNFRTAPYYLNKATKIFTQNEPEERIKLITAMCVSSLHQNISFKRAFNPILGETYEGYFCFEDDSKSDTKEGISRYSTNQLQMIRKKTQCSKLQPTNLK